MGNMTTIDLNAYKDVKMAKKIESGLKQSLKALQTCLDILKNHKQYVVVMESMSTLSTAHKITQLQLKKCSQYIEEHKK